VKKISKNTFVKN